MSVRSLRRPLGVLAVGATALITAATLGAPSQAVPGHKPKPPRMQQIQILSFNDFHGNLEAPAGSSGRIVTGHTFDANGKPVDTTQDVGGVEYLASHLKRAREGHASSLTVAAGDIIGASPLLSAALHDEPTIQSMNKLGLDVSSVGNHEFDEGYVELQRMANGGCLDDGAGANNQNSCPDGSFSGANFDYLAANVVYAGTKKSILPPYTIKDVNGAKIGFIGMTLKGTPDIVTAAGVKGLTFTDEVKTANKLVPVLKSKGVKAIVVLIHQGGLPKQQPLTNPKGETVLGNPTYDYTCAKGGALDPVSSPILDIAKNLDSEIDMVVSGHTHQPYVCDVKDPKGRDRLVTSASSFGRLYTDTELTYDRAKRDIVRTSVEGANMPVTRDQKDPEQTSLIAHYLELVTPIASKEIGQVTTDVKKDPPAGSTNGESQLGDLIADAQLADDSTVTNGKTPVIAFMNPGGIRADLTYAQSKYPGEVPGDVTYEEAFTVQPFNNYLVSMDLTGQDIYDILAQQVTGPTNGASPKILQISQGFTYKRTAAGAEDGSVLLNGTPIDKAATYRIVTNNFLQGGGDGFPSFTKGTDVYYGGLDIDAFADYLSAHSPYTPGPLTRIAQ
jgi:2',3'-cyclic-nucleotide 2'-phosphodiesterase (5'-nucleotidase family)